MHTSRSGNQRQQVAAPSPLRKTRHELGLTSAYELALAVYAPLIDETARAILQCEEGLCATSIPALAPVWRWLQELHPDVRLEQAYWFGRRRRTVECAGEDTERLPPPGAAARPLTPSTGV